MKNPKTFWLLLTTSLLVSCGGGGSPYVAKTDASCSLPLMFANGINSGMQIPDNEQWSSSSSATLSGCAIQGLETARVGICLDHPVLADLEIRIFKDSQNETLSLSPALASNSVCSIGGTAYQLNINTSQFTALTSLNGTWGVQVRDKRSGFKNGYFIGWSLEFTGFKR